VGEFLPTEKLQKITLYWRIFLSGDVNPIRNRFHYQWMDKYKMQTQFSAKTCVNRSIKSISSLKYVPRTTCTSPTCLVRPGSTSLSSLVKSLKTCKRSTSQVRNRSRDSFDCEHLFTSFIIRLRPPKLRLR
jgi:hypothetical protein